VKEALVPRRNAARTRSHGSTILGPVTRSVALRTGRSEEEVALFLGAAVVAATAVAALRVVDVVVDAWPGSVSRS
jgi:hypothetical protein